jgi:exopolyphosphatase/guanosine-5'-triphosphate,3'-diphosphate pyrophosphatase
MPRFATIDVGSSSLLIHLVEARADGSLEVLADHAVLCNLGEGLAERGTLSPQAIQRSMDTLASFSSLAEEHGVVSLVAVGTEALRRAVNASVLLQRARDELQLEIEVVSGPEEARLAFLGAVSSLPPSAAPTLVFDVGGGSTEFTLGRGGSIQRRLSLGIGALPLTARFLPSDPVTTGELVALEEHLSAALDGLRDTLGAADDGRGRWDLVGLGGSICNLAANRLQLSRYDPDLVHGTMLDLGFVSSQLDTLRRLSISQRRALPGIQPKRAASIVAGVAVVKAVLRSLDAPGLTVSDRGLRHGLLLDRFGAAEPSLPVGAPEGSSR